MNMNNVLVLAPHADDEVLGCGGTIARLTEQSKQMTVAILTNASQGAPELFNEALIQSIRQEAKNAHAILNVKNTRFFDLPAPQLEQYPQYKIANLIAGLIQEIKPDTLLIPHRGDLHMDHGAVYNAALVAARPRQGCHVKTILAYETLSETEWGHPHCDSQFIPQVFVALEEHHLNAKLDAMAAFASQLADFPHSRSLQAIRALAQFRGASVHHTAAEAFAIVRHII